MELIAKQWKYLAEGQNHFILSYVGTNFLYKQKVLRIKKQRGDSEREKQMDNQLTSIYNRYLEKIKLFDGILIKSDHFVIQQSKKKQFIDELWTQLQTQSKSKKKFEMLDYFAPIQVMQNLFKSIQFQNYTFMIQMKPKSPVFDMYQLTFLQDIASKNNLTLDEVVNKISKLPEKYLLRKFKRQIINNKKHTNQISSCQFFRGEPMNYLNQNPIMIQNYFYNNQLIQRSKLPLTDEQLNQTINEILNKSNILKKIITVINLFTKSYQRLQNITIQQSFDVLNSLDPQLFSQKIAQKTVLSYQTQTIQFQNSIIDTSPILQSQQQKFQQLFQYLVSTAFQDVSILLKIFISENSLSNPIRINQKFSADYEVKILDYDLKPFKRSKGKYVQEDLILLQKIFEIIDTHPTLQNQKYF